jgi:hypothetical protein
VVSPAIIVGVVRGPRNQKMPTILDTLTIARGSQAVRKLTFWHSRITSDVGDYRRWSRA